ncbi:hypothetical protein ABZ357_08095 [Streptomyces sp. NPDC005917]|uniref:hypothetical protein n=1 Tax=unclassified Streptomyces TaxID=2593676 RepID=UPI0033D71564
MHAIRVASAALLGVGALVLGAPAALTDDNGDGGRAGGRDTSFGFHVTPSTVSAGSRVSLQLNRGDGCRGAATVTSDVFGTVRIPAGRDSVTATVDRHARSQTSYRVTCDCDGTRGSAQLSIAGSHSDGQGDSGTDGAADGRTDGRTGGGTDGQSDSGTDGREELNPQPLPPERGVRAGAGGSIGGFDLKEIGLGAALVVGSVGTAYRLARRRAGESGEGGT